MGAQIAAQCVNAGIETLLFDLAAKEGSPNALVDKAIAHLSKLKPTPLALPTLAQTLQARNYEQHLADLANCDLVIEAIAERLDWKEELYRKIAPHLGQQTILATNTSGLSINTLAAVLPKNLTSRFCGIHFFNPPRYMHLAELIPAETTTPILLDELESWLTRYLGKGVVRAKDTPNFIANRIGVFSLLSTLKHAEAMNLGLDEVDVLTGVLIGRPKSATFRTMDVVGLDTMQHVVQTMQQQLKEDPWYDVFQLPTWLNELVQKGHLGQKTEGGIYRKQKQGLEVYDIASGQYRPLQAEVSAELKSIMKQADPTLRMQSLFASHDPQAQFLIACYRDLFHYTAYHLSDIADTVRDIDLAMRWGFGWQHGPFESWQLAGMDLMTTCIEKGIAEKLTLSQAALPTWLKSVQSFYSIQGAYAPQTKHYSPRSQLAVYQRQFFPQCVLGEAERECTVIYENAGVVLWALQDDIAVVSFKSKANTIGQDVLDGMQAAIEKAEERCQGLIFYQTDASNFSSGADLRGILAFMQAQKFKAIEDMVKQFQHCLMQVKYCQIPIIAALRGRALGGGCELLMHTAGIVAAFESYPGLVEVGVGLIPAGGGCKELALRAAAKAESADLISFIQPYFQQIATAVVAGSAPEAQKLGYLQAKDQWVMHTDEVLYAALAKVKALQAANYQPPLKSRFNVAGREGKARLQAGLVNYLEGGFISEHDYFLANQLAHVLCGGDLNQGEIVDEAWFLHLERQAFMNLATTALTQARISHLLETGKPLRN